MPRHLARRRCMTIRFLAGIVITSALGACGDNELPSTNNPPPDGGVAPDSGPTEVPLEREHAGGAPTSIDVNVTRGYIGVGPRLAIWELSTEPPMLLGET